MNGGELNPNHPTTDAMRDHWYKMCALLMHKLNLRDIDISTDDMQAFAQSGFCNIVVQPASGAIHLRLVSDGEAMRLVKQAGGKPV